MMKRFICGIILTVSFGSLVRAETVLLWPEGAPLAQGNGDDDRPSLDVMLPTAEKSVGAAVVVCPGGGYGHLAMDHEGVQIGRWLNDRGISAFILKYRIALKYHDPCPRTDASRAIRWVRSQAERYALKPDKIGIWGFSAGGHLASTVSTHFDAGKADAEDPIDRASSRPDFSILSYPVISMKDPFTHKGSRENLLGKTPSADLIELLSNESQVSPQTPPTFIFHTNEDAAVFAEPIVEYYLALRKHRVPAELHIYERGPHGVGLASKIPAISNWPDRLADWLVLRRILPSS